MTWHEAELFEEKINNAREKPKKCAHCGMMGSGTVFNELTGEHEIVEYPDGKFYCSEKHYEETHRPNLSVIEGTKPVSAIERLKAGTHLSKEERKAA